MNVQPHEIRKYDTSQGVRAYFTATDLSAVSIHSIPSEVVRKSRHVEAVHPSGWARVLKSTEQETGIIGATTEPK